MVVTSGSATAVPQLSYPITCTAETGPTEPRHMTFENGLRVTWVVGAAGAVTKRLGHQICPMIYHSISLILQIP